MMLTVLKIISGGQTGVDRAALDVAIELGLKVGGWCPKGRLAEDGIIPEKYPLIETSTSDYAQRTSINVQDSDGTLIISFGKPFGGTKLTVDECIKFNKPHLNLNALELNLAEAVKLVCGFISNHKLGTLNIAGPRHSDEPRGYSFTKHLLLKLFISQT